MVITIGGVMSMSFSRKERNSIPDHGHGTVVKGIVFGTIGALCHGVGLVFSKKGFLLQANHKFPIEPVTGSFIRFFTAAVIVIIFLLLNKKLAKQISIIRHQSTPVLRTAVSAILLGPVLAVSCAMISIQYINVAISQTIFALVPVVVLFIAHYLYKEKITRHAMLGVLLALAGVSILVWRNALMSLVQ
jgi:drug/metabolite transporter (DMT)-like permease